MAGEVYSRVVGQGGQQNALAKFLNLKRIFVDAQRQNQIDMIREQRKIYAEQQNSVIKHGLGTGELQISPEGMATGGGVDYGGFHINRNPEYKYLAESPDPEGMEKAGVNAQGKPYYRKSPERVALIQMDTQKGKEYDKVYSASLGAIDTFNSLKNSYYEGFAPVNVKVDTATLFDTTGAKIKGLTKKLDAALGKNPAARTYLQNLKGFATTISRGALAERGTLTDTDRKVVVDMFNLALANKEEADYAFGVMGEILAKPALRAAQFRMKKFGESYDSVELPGEFRQKIDIFIQEGYAPEEAMDYLLNKKYK